VAILVAILIRRLILVAKLIRRVVSLASLVVHQRSRAVVQRRYGKQRTSLLQHPQP
jgi:hypothetical protein